MLFFIPSPTAKRIVCHDTTFEYRTINAFFLALLHHFQPENFITMPKSGTRFSKVPVNFRARGQILELKPVEK